MNFVYIARIVRCSEDTYQHQLVAEKANSLQAIYDSLNYVASCPWIINRKVC